MRLLAMLAIFVLAACDDARTPKKPDDTIPEAARRHFSQYDQIIAFATARPSKERIAYDLRIQNVGSEPIVGIHEIGQQWQPLEGDRRDLTEWNEEIPIGDTLGIFELAPGEEYRCEAEPKFRRGARLRFGFLVFCQVGEEHRRLRVWTDTRIPDHDFRGLLGTPGAQE